MATPGAQDALVHHVKASPLSDWNPEMIGAFVVCKPTAQLMEALLTRVEHEKCTEGHMLLALTALASRGCQRKSSICKRVHSLMLNHLDELHRVEQFLWSPLHNASAYSTESIWSEMHSHVRETWIGHHAQLDGNAHAWEADKSEWYGELVDHAKEMLRMAHVNRQDPAVLWREASHHNQVLTALRAAKNLRHKGTALHVCKWLLHPKEELAIEAADVLLVLESDQSERHVLGALRAELEPSPQHKHRPPRSRVVHKLLKTLLHWSKVRSDTASEAVRHLLHLPSYLHGKVKMCETICQARCNPHAPSMCQNRCADRCQDDVETARLLKKIAHRASKHPQRHDLMDHVRKHFFTAHRSHHQLAQHVHGTSGLGRKSESKTVPTHNRANDVSSKSDAHRYSAHPQFAALYMGVLPAGEKRGTENTTRLRRERSHLLGTRRLSEDESSEDESCEIADCERVGDCASCTTLSMGGDDGFEATLDGWEDGKLLFTHAGGWIPPITSELFHPFLETPEFEGEVVFGEAGAHFVVHAEAEWEGPFKLGSSSLRLIGEPQIEELDDLQTDISELIDDGSEPDLGGIKLVVEMTSKYVGDEDYPDSLSVSMVGGLQLLAPGIDLPLMAMDGPLFLGSGDDGGNTTIPIRTIEPWQPVERLGRLLEVPIMTGLLTLYENGEVDVHAESEATNFKLADDFLEFKNVVFSIDVEGYAFEWNHSLTLDAQTFEEHPVLVTVAGELHVGGDNGFNAAVSGTIDTLTSVVTLTIAHAGGWAPIPALADFFVTPHFTGELTFGIGNSSYLSLYATAAWPADIDLGTDLVSLVAYPDSGVPGVQLGIALEQEEEGSEVAYEISFAGGLRLLNGHTGAPPVLGVTGTLRSDGTADFELKTIEEWVPLKGVIVRAAHWPRLRHPLWLPAPVCSRPVPNLACLRYFWFLPNCLHFA